MFTVLIVTVTIDLLLAVGIGMVMASFLFMKRITDMQIANTRAVTNPEEIGEELALSAQEAEIMQQANDQIMLFHMSGPMSFSSAKAIVRRHAEILNYSIMVLDLSDVPSIDFTTSRALEDIITDTLSANRHMILVGGNKEVCDMLLKQGVLEHIDNSHMFKDRINALLLAQTILGEKSSS
ncbi:MAG: STAS domain-containing protein [Gammaproteobacteria bacterium]|nr:STAS domain-containing protein [Gammaproteobacteria bacterium]